LSAAALIGSLAPAAVAQVRPPGDDPAAAERRSRLQGTALIDRRNRVIGAVVLVQPEADPSRLFLTATDEDGTFRLDGLDDGVYRVALNRNGFYTVIKEGVEVKYPFRAVVEVKMTPGEDAADAAETASVGSTAPIWITGTVTSGTGRPLKEARVRLVHPVGDRDPHSARSDAQGTFELALPAGAWQFQINAVGYLPMATELRLAEDTRVEMRMVPQPADYVPGPMELMPPERLIPPDGLLE
jgi:hypothetical protein